MEKLDQPELIEKWIREIPVSDIFDTPDLSFEAYRFERGELILSPLREADHIYFLTEGSVRIYGILGDGRMIPVNYEGESTLLGDMEFVNGGRSRFFCEATEETSCLALSVPQNRELLNTDLKFLHTLLRSFEQKLSMFALLDVGAPTLEERVLIYLKSIYPNSEYQGMDAFALKLRCSRRQLQRVLKRLCEEGKVCKAGRGLYRLSEEASE